MSRDCLGATYRILSPAGEIQERAEALRLEQSAELPLRAIRDPGVVRNFLPQIVRIEACGTDEHRVTLEFPGALTAEDPAQLLNLLYGNSSLKEDLILEAIEVPDGLLAHFPGPRFGVAGLRKAAGVAEGPLTCTALKPMGLDAEALAGLCATFARAGIDVIKDDHSLADHAFCRFEDRVRACREATARVAQERGKEALYVPNLLGTPAAILQQLDICREAGVAAVMMTPMLCGMPAFYELAESVGMPILAHPSLAGLRMTPPVLLGTLFRLYGADAVIFPHFGGRFSYSADTCRQLAARLRQPSTTQLPSLPVPAGGMDASRAASLVQFYGPDVMLLIGGSLYLAGDRLLQESRSFVRRVHNCAATPEGSVHHPVEGDGE